MKINKNLIEFYENTKEKLGKSDVPLAVLEVVNTIKRKSFVKKVRKDLKGFYKDTTYSLVLDQLEVEQELGIKGSNTQAVSALQARMNKNTSVANAEFAKKLDESRFFDIYKEIKTQEEAYKRFPEVFDNAEQLEKYQEILTGVMRIQPKIKETYRRKNLTKIYDKKMAEVNEFISAYIEVLELLQ